MYYETLLYKVEFTLKGMHCKNERTFKFEDDAVNFVEREKNMWSDYEMYRIDRALIYKKGE